MAKYDEASCVKDLKRNRNLTIKEPLIEVAADAELGIKVWSKIDYLCNYCGYKWIKVAKKVTIVKDSDEDKPKKKYKKNKDVFGIKNKIRNSMKF